MLQLDQLKCSINIDSTKLKPLISKKLHIKEQAIISYEILKRSLDARRKDNIVFVFSLKLNIKNEQDLLNKKIKNLSIYQEPKQLTDYSKKSLDKTKKICVIGFGPAGMFNALYLSRNNVLVDVYERGEAVENRLITVDHFIKTGILNKDSNIQFGEGGAGTFSDGKLTNRKKDYRNYFLFDELVKAGAPSEIKYVNNPHIGTDLLVNVVKNIRKDILSTGSNIFFNSKVEEIIPCKDGYNIVVNNETKYYDYIVLAIGHSSRDTVEMLSKTQITLDQKAFAVGFRIEHPQIMINKAQYGSFYNHPSLGAAEYKLTHQTKEKGVYTFCMCPGGTVVPASSEEGLLCVNGMSEYKRDKVNANSALLVTVNKEDFGSDHKLAGLYYQREIEKKAFILGGSNYKAPIQRVKDFIENKPTTSLGKVLPSYPLGVTPTNLRTIYSDKLNKAFIETLQKMGNKLKGFNDDDVLLTGVETRSSSPVRFTRDKETMQNLTFKNFYPTGEGAGYAGGIVSAAIDGIKVAQKILDELIIE